MAQHSWPQHENQRWQAVQQRDSESDGRFVYAVRTTGIFCRPSCPSRRPKRENVVFFADPESAVEAGFRPCRRCRPDQRGPSPAERAVARACRLIETSEELPSLDALAESVGLSPHHFHRTFKRLTGVTPRAWAAERRAARLRDNLVAAQSVTSAMYDAGYAASSRLYEESGQRLGMRPTEFRAGGPGQRIRFALAETSLGTLLVAATERGVCAIEFGDDPQALVTTLQDRFHQAELLGADPAFEETVARICAYVEQPAGSLDLPLDIRGTAFQHRVWAELRKIPAGQTFSYAEVARAIGSPGAHRAVAQACARNPVAVAVPCHRVVRTDGGLSGYRWGVARKAALIAREAAADA